MSFTKEDIVEKCVRRFGWGSNRLLRQALYERLGRVVEEKGEEAYRVIATCAVDAENSRKDKGHHFAFIVVRRLVEHGILPPPEL